MLGGERRLWRSPFAASEDRNVKGLRDILPVAEWRSPFAASEDRNCSSPQTAEINADKWRSPFAASEDRNNASTGAQDWAYTEWRSPFAASEDRNRIACSIFRSTCAWWRSPFAASEDRNVVAVLCSLQGLSPWRSPFAASEDRNRIACSIFRSTCAVALAVRGERGSQPGQLHPGGERHGARGWRSPFAASEDRNADTISVISLDASVALAVRGERGSQQGHHCGQG